MEDSDSVIQVTVEEDPNAEAARHLVKFLEIHGVLNELAERPGRWHTFKVDLAFDGDKTLMVDSLYLGAIEG